jgi:hypothetical protein
MGGRESWDNEKRGVRKLALKLRAMNLPGVTASRRCNITARILLTSYLILLYALPRPCYFSDQWSPYL